MTSRPGGRRYMWPAPPACRLARLLERVSALDLEVRVVDTHPLDPHDPSGIDVFYLMLVATIVGFLTVFQWVPHAGRLSNRQWWLSIVLLSIVASLVFGPSRARSWTASTCRSSRGWGILALQVLAVASFARLTTLLIGRWAILPTWVFFVVLGNSASGGFGPAAVAAPVRPRLAMASVGRHRHGPAKRRSTSTTTSRPVRYSCWPLGRRCCSPPLTVASMRSSASSTA